MTCSLSRYNVKGDLLHNGGFPQIIHFNVYKRKQLQSTFLRKKSTRQCGIFNNYKEKLSVPRVYTLLHWLSLKQQNYKARSLYKAWSPYSCNSHKHRRKHVSDSVPSSSDTCKHFDYNIASLTGIVINCSVSSSCNGCSNHWRRVSSLVSDCIANLNLRDMAKQLLTPSRLIAHMNFSLTNYSCELVNLTGTAGKVELIWTSTTAVCESWNVSAKCTWDNVGDLKQLPMDQTLSEDNRSN